MRELRWSEFRARAAGWLATHRWFVALLLVWTIELWWSQSVTTAPTLWSAGDMVKKDVFFRLLFDMLGIALLLVMGYYLLTVMVKWLDGRPEFRPDLLLWLPNLLFIAVGAGLFRRMER